MTERPLPIKTYIAVTFGTLLGLFALFDSFFTADGGYNYVVQDTLRGSYSVYTDPGMHFVVPFFNKVTAYKQVATINFSGGGSTNGIANVADSGDFTTQSPSIDVTFADTYGGMVPAQFRISLPRDYDSMLKIHEDFRSFPNLVNALMTQTTRDVAVVTATQFTGEEFFQGGVNEFKVRLVGQLREGIYVTKRQQVTIEDVANAPVSSTNSDATKAEVVERRVWKNVVQLGPDGEELRSSSPFAAYNIIAAQVTIGRPVPDPRLDKLLDSKRTLVAARIEAIEGQLTAVAQAQAVQQKGEIQKAQAIQIAQREKELAIIAGQQTVAVERQQAERETVVANKAKALAVISKESELAIAQANRGIQEAAAEAAIFEANALKATGLAQAEVLAANLAAKSSAMPIVLAELDLEKAKIVYPALKGITVTMPTYYSAGGTGDAAPTSLDVMTTIAATQALSKNAGDYLKVK
jgi:hypothetical protein